MNPTLLRSLLLRLAPALLISFAGPLPAQVDADADADPAPFRFLGGDIDRGLLAFQTLQCNTCHEVAGQVIPEPSLRRLDLLLGKEARFVTRYQDLILAITAPRHVMAQTYRDLLLGNDSVEPFMPRLTWEMSAQQLIDLVTFLDQAYASEHPGYMP